MNSCIVCCGFDSGVQMKGSHQERSLMLWLLQRRFRQPKRHTGMMNECCESTMNAWIFCMSEW